MAYLVIGSAIFLLWHVTESSGPAVGGNKINVLVRNQSKNNLSRQINSKAPFKMSGLAYNNYNDGRLMSSVKADVIKVERRKFWAFNVRPFTETVLENASIQLHLYTDQISDGGEQRNEHDMNMLSFGKEVLSVGSSFNDLSMNNGLVTRGVMKGLTLEIFEDKNQSMLITAQKAFVDFKKKALKMVNVYMKDISTGKMIKSRSVIWNDKKNVFEINGQYIADTEHGILKGEMISVDLDFDISPLKRGKG